MPRKRFTNQQIAFALRQAVTEALDALVRLRGRPKWELAWKKDPAEGLIGVQ